MKTIVCIIGLLLANTCAAQCENAKVFDINKFEKCLHDKTDTIYFKATFIDIGKIPQREIMNQLISKKLIKAEEYELAIGFVPLDTDISFYLPFRDVNGQVSSELYKRQNQNKIICITGVVFKGYKKFNNKPFFTVSSISIE
jgi:hypothetical protein